jgi:hypothetical protein
MTLFASGDQEQRARCPDNYLPPTGAPPGIGFRSANSVQNIRLENRAWRIIKKSRFFSRLFAPTRYSNNKGRSAHDGFCGWLNISFIQSLYLRYADKPAQPSP